MNKRFEFRVWDKLLNKFIKFELIGKIDFNDVSYIFQQYTSRKDKTGRKIYEGDIIKYTNYGSKNYGFESVSAVEWSDTGLGFLSLANMNEYHVEVIGNIYENPELLK